MAGLVTVTTPVAGTPVSSTTFGIPVSTDVPVLANPPTAKLTNSVGISIANNTATALTWDTESWDAAGGHSTVTNPSRYTCQTGYAGKYRVDVVVYYVANATGAREAWFEVNGTSQPAGSSLLPGAATIVSVSAFAVVQLAVGDYVEAFTLQTSGGALSTNNDVPRRQSCFTVQWISQ